MCVGFGEPNQQNKCTNAHPKVIIKYIFIYVSVVVCAMACGPLEKKRLLEKTARQNIYQLLETKILEKFGQLIFENRFCTEIWLKYPNTPPHKKKILVKSLTNNG